VQRRARAANDLDPGPGETEDLARVAAAVRDSGIAVDEIALRRPTLDDAFLELTGHGVEPGEAAQEVLVA